MWLGLQNSHLLVKIPCRRPYVTQTTTFWWQLFSNKKRNRSFLRNLNQENDFNELDDRPESWKSKYWRRVIMNDKLSSSDCLHESSRNDVVEADKKIASVSSFTLDLRPVCSFYLCQAFWSHEKNLIDVSLTSRQWLAASTCQIGMLTL